MKTSQLREKFKEVFGVEAEHTLSPGRINLIELLSMDYNGHAFPAYPRYLWAACKRSDKVCSSRR